MNRAFSPLCLALYLSVLICAGQARAEDSDTPGLPPDVAVKYKEFLKKLTQAQRKSLDAKMDKLIAEIAKATVLQEEGIKALKTAAVQAEDAEQREMGKQNLKVFTMAYNEIGEKVLAKLDDPGIIERATGGDVSENPEFSWTHADAQPVWKEALAKVLTPEQLAALDKPKSSEEIATEKAINTYLDAQEESMRTRAGSQISATVTELISTLALPKERADAVNALAKKATDETVVAMRKETAEALRKYNKLARENILKNGRGSFYVVPDKDAEGQPVWKDGLATLLTEVERAQIKANADSHRLHRTQSLGRLMVQLLDERLALTEEQRTRLQPIAERIVQGQQSLFPDRSRQYYYSYDRDLFYKATKEAKADEIRPLLDDTQWKRWQDLPNLPSTSDDEDGPRNNPATAPDKEPAGPSEPEDLEAAVADYLVGQTANQFRQCSETMLLQVEDIRRVAQAGAGSTARLRTAALGAAEAATGAWLVNTEANLRSELQNATADNIQQKIAGMSRYSFSRSEPEDNSVWNAALSAEMTPDQTKAWQEVRDAREAYKSKAIAAFAEAELDRKIMLTREQWDKLAPLLAKTVQEYGPDIRSTFSYRSYAWYLQSYTLYLPFHAIPDADVKALLTPAQYDAWTGSQEYNYSSSYWDNVRSNHERRVKPKKG